MSHPLATRRKNVRYQPDPGTVALIDLINEKPSDFNVGVAAIVENESHRGCGLLLLWTEALQPGDVFLVQVGLMDPMRAQVRYRRELDNLAVKLGVQFLD